MLCKHCDAYTNICANPDCPMRADECPVPDTEGICRYEDRPSLDESWKFTPKGCASSALKTAGLVKSVSDPVVDVFWEEFSRLMKLCGYVKEEKE